MRMFTRTDREQMANKLKGAKGDHLFALLALRNALESRDSFKLEKAKKSLEKIYLSHEDQHPFELSSSDPKRQEFAEQMARYIGLSPDESLKHLEGRRPGPKALADSQRLLSYEVTRQIDFPNVQIVPWWHKGQFVPAIYCKDIETAYYVHTFFIAPTGVIGWRICPYCTNPFEQSRPDKDYCCDEHGDAYRMARMRYKKKNQKQRGEEKNGTQKAR